MLRVWFSLVAIVVVILYEPGIQTFTVSDPNQPCEHLIDVCITNQLTLCGSDVNILCFAKGSSTTRYLGRSG